MRLFFDVTCLVPKKISGVGIYSKFLFNELKNSSLELRPIFKGSRVFKKSFTQDHIQMHGQPFWPLLSNLKFRKGDVFHGPDFKLITETSRCRKVVSVHDLAVFHEGFNADKFRAKGQAALDAMVRRGRPDAVVVPCQTIKTEISERYPEVADRVFAIGYGCDHLGFKTQSAPLRKPDRPYFLYVGAFENRKNVYRIVKAFDLFCANEKDYDLFLVGKDGFAADRVHQAVQNSSHREKIKILGFVENDQLQTLYTQANAFVFPSLYEGFGFPPLEAMISKCPVITSSHGTMAEIAGDAAFLAKAQEIESICEGLKFFTNEKNRTDFITKGLKRSAEFTWKTTAAEHLGVYQQ